MAGKVDAVNRIIILAFCFFSLSCSGPRISKEQGGGVYHRVKKGETLYRIAQAYKVNFQYLAEVNNVDNPELIGAGRVLFIPNAQEIVDDILTTSVKTADVQAEEAKKSTPASRKVFAEQGAAAPSNRDEERKITHTPKAVTSEGIEKTKPLPEKLSSPAPSVLPQDITSKGAAPAVPEAPVTERAEGIPGEEQQKINFDKKRFIWPTVGRVIAQFGIQQNGMFFNGIKIASKEGAAVVAAAAGTVIFSAPLKDYGEAIIIKHEDNFATVYTNLGQRLVKRDDHVKRGDRVALSGRTEKNKEPVIHFEIRQKNKARNPLFFLP